VPRTAESTDAPRTFSDSSSAPRAVAALFVPPADGQHLLIAALSLRAAGIPVMIGGPSVPSLQPFIDAGYACVEAEVGADLVNQAWKAHGLPVLAVSDAVILPENFLGPALDLLAGDVRIATVSFISNDAGLLSFPENNRPSPRLLEGHDAVSLTRLLRERGPRTKPTPIPTAKGAAVLLSETALGAAGGLTTGQATSMDYSIAEFCARTRSRGFVHLLDDTTFLARQRSPASSPWAAETVDDMDPVERNCLHVEYPMEVAFIHAEATSHSAPLALSLRLAKAKVQGLRILVDGSYLGPHEMGTQVSMLATIDALRLRDEVHEVVVALTQPIPDYARDVMTAPKVRAEQIPLGDLTTVGHVNVAHRMIQPDMGFSVSPWKQAADVVVITFLDLIAYRIGAYHETAEGWARYRNAIRRGAAEADAITVISDDVKLQVELERLPIDPSRLASVPFGTEHLRGDEAASIPGALLERGFVDGQFVLCLGTDYTHKNRDLALATMAELRARGWPHALVMAGPTVSDGSSRLSETRVILGATDNLDHDVYSLPDVSSAERNWLLWHADLVLYPTSAEGFGFVPYEAARFGTPSLFINFGPLHELAPDIPVVAKDWLPTSLASSAERLLGDPALAQAQVEACLTAGATYTWAATAGDLIDLYYRVLAMPPR
jgi:glycosyltransferase involved in cell wall biosynthesis